MKPISPTDFDIHQIDFLFDEPIVVTRAQCIKYADDYQHLGLAPEISIQRATILMGISRSWAILDGQLARLAAIEMEEKPNPPN
jgi:hypothetical protein